MVAVVAFLVYLLTLNHWVTMSSLPVVAKVTGWDASPPFQAPLYYVLTFPLRWLPSAWQPVALNGFAALCGALTLALLARSVVLLPHDRTREQRLREHSEFSLLSLPTAWMPPVLAAAVCGLQLTFWEHATASTGETLDLLVFAFVIWSLLEYRLDRRPSRLTRAALVYGLGITNNWGMIGFFPLFLTALVWIMGREFFQLRFLGRMAAWGGAGLLLYLVPAAWTAMSEVTQTTFGQALWYELVTQKNILARFPKYLVLLLGLTSLLPVLIISIRWPSSFGDTSILGATLTNVMFRVVHAVFLVACVWVAFDPKFSPRALAQGLPMLTFYYLGALSIGYFVGYFLLVFGPVNNKSRHRPSPIMQALGPVVTALVWVGLVAVPAGLIYKNWPSIRATNSPLLADFASAAVQVLPPRGAVVVGDEPGLTLLLEAALSRRGANHPHVLLSVPSLPYHAYHVLLRKRYGDRLPDLLAEEGLREPIDSKRLTQFLLALTQSHTNAVFYANPSFGFFFETLYLRPRGLLFEVQPFTTAEAAPPPLTPAEIEANQTVWGKLWPNLDPVAQRAATESPDAQFIARNYSRCLNAWGVSLQRHGQLEEAGRFFAKAKAMNSDNVVADINSQYNERLRRGERQPVAVDKKVENAFARYRGWDPILMANGPIDEPALCFQLGQEYTRNSLFRQAAQQFLRVAELTPEDLRAQLALAAVYLEGQVPDETITLVARLRSRPTGPPLSLEQQLELVRLEALAHLAKSRFARDDNKPTDADREFQSAEQILLRAQQQFPQQHLLLDTLAQLYWSTDRLTNALAVMDRQLQLTPDNVTVHLNKAALLLQQQDYAAAQQHLDRALQLSPGNFQALFLQVSLHMSQKDYAKADQTLDRILEIDPKNPQALLAKSAVAIETKTYEKAFEPLDQILAEQPTHWAALMNRAIANLQLGRLKAAERDYEQLRKLRPTFHAVYYGLGEIAFRRKDTQAAIAHYERYLKFAPKGLEEANTVSNRLVELRASAGQR